MTEANSEKKTDRRIRKTHQAIRRALQTLLQHATIDQITVRQIAEEADIAYTTFFRHFESKEAALAALAEAEVASLLDLTLPLLNEEGSGRTANLNMTRHIDADRHLWSALLSGGNTGVVRDIYIRQTEERVALWPDVPQWVPANNGTALIIGLVVEILTWWLSRAPDETPEKVAELLDRMVVAPLLAPE